MTLDGRFGSITGPLVPGNPLQALQILPEGTLLTAFEYLDAEGCEDDFQCVIEKFVNPVYIAIVPPINGLLQDLRSSTTIIFAQSILCHPLPATEVSDGIPSQGQTGLIQNGTCYYPISYSNTIDAFRLVKSELVIAGLLWDLYFYYLFGCVLRSRY